MDVASVLRVPKSVAIVGLSDNPDRPSFQVATYLREHGFTIIPVNPKLTQWSGIPSFPSIKSIPRETTIDIVDIFRKSSEVMAIVTEVINSARAPVIWMQEGVSDDDAAMLARNHSLEVIMDACIMKAHKRLLQASGT